MSGSPTNPWPDSDAPSWQVGPERYLELLRDLCQLAARVAPDAQAVVGIRRSGLFPAVYISHQLELAFFTCSETKSFPFPRITRPIIVDSTVWSGKTARCIVKRLERRGVLQVPVFTMFVRAEPFPEVAELHYLELTDRIVKFWYEEQPR